MGGSHTHDHTPRIPLRSGPVRMLLAFLALCAVATLAGVAMLWPDGDKVRSLQEDAQFAGPGVTFVKARVSEVQQPCPDTRSLREDCGGVSAEVTEGPDRGTTQRVNVPAAVAESGLGDGDTVRLLRVPPPADGQPAVYSFDDVVRLQPLWILSAVFVLIVAVVARLRGLLALVSLGFGGAVLFEFMLPALLSGSSGLAVALAGSSAIMFVVLYLAHGPSVRTSVALAGTLIGVGITAAVGELAVGGASLSGLADDSTAQLSAFATDVSFQGLMMCALVVAGLGILNDVTITQASSVWELRAAGPTLNRRQLFGSGMRIGRDHIASTIYTIVFAYAGSALAVLLLISLYDRPLLHLLSSESIAEEIVRTLASGIGLVLAVPVTTAIAALTIGSPQEDGVDAGHGRHQA